MCRNVLHLRTCGGIRYLLNSYKYLASSRYFLFTIHHELSGSSLMALPNICLMFIYESSGCSRTLRICLKRNMRLNIKGSQAEQIEMKENSAKRFVKAFLVLIMIQRLSRGNYIHILRQQCFMLLAP